MKVLVTGANGYIGKNVCEEFEKEGIDFFRGTRDNFDLNNQGQMENFIKEKKVTHIVHLAAYANGSEYSKLFESNIDGLYRLLVAIKNTGVRHLVFASGNNVYGENNTECITEALGCNPSVGNCYALSKYVGELLIKDFLSNTETEYTILRIADVYGPNQKFGNLIKAIVKSINEKTSIKLYGQGQRTRDYLYISDLVRGIVFCSVNELTGIYNLSTGKGTDVRELVDIALKISEGKCNVEKVDVEKEDTSSIVLDSSKLRNKGFTSRISIEEGLRKCVDNS